MANQKRIIALCIASTVIFALQHPLSKPFVDQIGTNWVGRSKAAVVYSAITLIAILTTALFFKDSWRQYTFLLKNTFKYKVVIGSAFLSSISALFYIFGQGSFKPSTLALILNTPISAIFITYIHQERPIPLLTMLATASTFCCVGVALWFESGIKAQDFFIELCLASIMLIVPVTYILGFTLRKKYISNFDAHAGVMATATLSSLITTTIVTLILVGSGESFAIPIIPSHSWVMFSVGTVVLILFGSTSYQAAISGGASPAYISLYHTMIPILTAGFGWLVFQLGYSEFQASPGQIIAILAAFPFIAYVIYKTYDASTSK
ncbi:MAG: hypothetical protein IKE42_15990 [Aquamicrobium sp.]|nr:hypothetical protein [Aquamicrobium sp.]